jgi:hypothetical protein
VRRTILQKNPVLQRVIFESRRRRAADVWAVIGCDADGIRPGFWLASGWAVGYWESTQVCSMIIAWRTIHIMANIVRAREQPGTDLNDTLSSLVYVLQSGNRDKNRIQRLGDDQNIGPSAMIAQLDRVSITYPTGEALLNMWQKLPGALQVECAHEIQAAIKAGHIQGDISILLQSVNMTLANPNAASNS